MSNADATEASFWADEADDSLAIQRYRTLVNAVSDGIYQLDASGRFLAVNDVIVELSGYTRDGLLGEHVLIVLEDDDVDRITRTIARCVANDTPLTEPLAVTAQTADGSTLLSAIHRSSPIGNRP